MVTLIVVLAVAFAALITWFRQPLDAMYGRNGLDGFDVEGLVPMASGLFAFALGTAAGAVLRAASRADRVIAHLYRSARHG